MKSYKILGSDSTEWYHPLSGSPLELGMKQGLEGQTKAQWQPDFMDNFVVGEVIVYLVIWWEKSIVEVTHESGLQKGKNRNPKK
jgi:hypothetical protein